MNRASKLGVVFGLLIGSACTSAVAGEVVVTQKNKSFDKVKISAKLGDKIVFKNAEADITHNVYSITPGNEFELRVQRPGETSDIVLDPKKHKKGKMTVECAIHPTMRLEVDVK